MPYAHLMAGVPFPESLHGFSLSGVDRHDRFGHDLGAKYHPDEGQVPAKVTIYVYPGLRPLDDEFASTIADVLQANPGAALMGETERTLGGQHGRWAACEVGLGAERAQSMAWLFLVDGWHVKMRATGLPDVPVAAIAPAAEALLVGIGWPNTTARCVKRLAEARERARQRLADLEAWAPRALADDAVLRQVENLRRLGQLRSAIEFLGEQPRDSHPGRNAEFGRLNLLAGDPFEAAEACMAEEELDAAEAQILEAALKAYVPPDVEYAGGWGTSPEDPVQIHGTRTDGDVVCAQHRFLELALGERGCDWKLNEAVLFSTAHGSLQNAAHLLLPNDQEIVVFFDLNAPLEIASTLPLGTTLGRFITGGTVRGAATKLHEEGFPMPTTKAEFAALETESQEAIQFVMGNVMRHSCQTLVLAPDEML